MFIAEIYSKFQSKYHLYFLLDGAFLKNVAVDAIEKISDTEEWTKRKRADFLSIPFMHEGHQWQAVEVGKRHRINKYVTTLVDADDSFLPNKTDKRVWLPVYLVQKLIKEQQSSS